MKSVNSKQLIQSLTPEQRQRLKAVLAKKGQPKNATEARVNFVDSLSPAQREAFIELQKLEKAEADDKRSPKLQVKYFNGSATRPPK
ncbi:hypothetical protein [Nostoc sp. FACHB-110]|uniref:hypothetical protein n=1 Tax=Nostoc sp. FACHB-110 TaxID=2692834 RepID=UPI0016885CB1|nr:hypothetical protein [Nostoc sp. FACHB-110]MBD2435447.1 hypothetical protein [Nostoc sp. FACHB-110]